jgi:hypothetical protein
MLGQSKATVCVRGIRNFISTGKGTGPEMI